MWRRDSRRYAAAAARCNGGDVGIGPPSIRRRSCAAEEPRTFPDQEHREYPNHPVHPDHPLFSDSISFLHLDAAWTIQPTFGHPYDKFLKKLRSQSAKRIAITINRSSVLDERRIDRPLRNLSSAPPYDLLLLLA